MYGENVFTLHGGGGRKPEKSVCAHALDIGRFGAKNGI
jgi:hypothetical protein